MTKNTQSGDLVVDIAVVSHIFVYDYRFTEILTGVKLLRVWRWDFSDFLSTLKKEFWYSGLSSSIDDTTRCVRVVRRKKQMIKL